MSETIHKSKMFGSGSSRVLTDNTAVPFCKCSKKVIDRRLATVKILKNTCNCGEDVGTLEWNWEGCEQGDKEQQVVRSDVIFEGNVVTFHPIYSQGAAVIRAERPLEPGTQSYWEIKILSFLTGTDLMIGVGTDKVDIHSHRYTFCSFLGLNDQSWGFSYRGLVQNNGRLKYYGKKYSRGCIVGVHLDLERGSIEFYLNRRPLGKAYTNIPLDKNTKLYPMVCSTSAKTSIKLINCVSVKANLQYYCIQSLAKHPALVEQMKSIPGLRRLSDELWFLQCKEKYEYQSEFEKNNLLLEDEAIISSKKKKYMEESDNESSLDSTEDLYKNAHRIKHFKRSNKRNDTSSDDSDNENSVFPFFCDHF